MIEANYLLKIFNASPSPSLLLLPDAPCFTIKQANNAFLLATGTQKADLCGKGFFEIFPVPFATDNSNETSIIFQSFLSVIRSGKSDKVFNQWYNLPANKNIVEPRFFNINNIAICNDNNEISYILQTPEPVTENWYYHQLEILERDILEMNANKDKTLSEVLTCFMLGIEKLHPGMICSMQEKRAISSLILLRQAYPGNFYPLSRALK